MLASTIYYNIKWNKVWGIKSNQGIGTLTPFEEDLLSKGLPELISSINKGIESDKNNYYNYYVKIKTWSRIIKIKIMFLNVFNLLMLLAPWDPVVRLIELIEILDEHDNADKIYMMIQTRDYL